MGPRSISTTPDMDKTREQLITELQDLRVRLAGIRDGKGTRSRLAAIVDSSDDAIIGKALDGTITSWNKSAERLYGYSEAEAVGRPIGIVVPPDRTRELEWILSMIRRGGRVEHHETVRVTKDGRRVDVSVTISPIFDSAGRIVGASTIARDITGRKRAEEALRKARDELEVAVEQRTASLRETRDYLESLLNYANAPIIVWDPDFTITRFNHAFERLSGYGADEVVGKNLSMLFPPGSARESLEKIRSTLAGERWESVEIPILRKDGSIRIALWNSANVNNEKGELLATIAQGQDVTERKQAEEALLEKQEELKAQAEELEVQAEELRVNNEELERQMEVRRRAEEALRASEQKFRILADFTYDWVIWSGPEGNYIYISPSCERITGRRADEFYHDTGLLDRIVHPDDRVVFEQHVDSHLRNASLYGNFDFRIITTSGETRWINHVCRPVFRDDGEWLGRRASNRDITERKRAEEALRKLSKAVEENPATIVITDVKGNIEYVNPKFTELTGYSFEEAIGQNPRILKTGETPPGEYKRLWETITSGRDWHGVFHNKKKNGDLYWESAIISPIMDDAGRITNFIAVKEDITERKRMEDALRESEERFHAVADNIPVLAWMADADGQIFWFNKQVYDYTGLTQEELQGRGWEKVIHPDYVKSVTDVWRSMIETGQSGSNVFPMRGKDGRYRWFLVRSQPIRNENGVITRWFGTSTDITERKQAEEALEDYKKHLEDLVQERTIKLEEEMRQADLYVDLMSHDITNMNQALMGYLEMMELTLESGAIDKGLIDNSMQVVKRSTKMIDDVKKLTLLREGNVPLKDVDLCKILSEVISRHSDVPGRAVTINYTPRRDCIVRADDLLDDVFDNLVDNAIRHSTGPVAIDLAVDRVEVERHIYYRVTVTDTGPGIPDDLKDSILMTIMECKDKTKRRGFGLCLVRALIDYYHGRVWVEDRVQGDHTQGARFVVLLPSVEK